MSLDIKKWFFKPTVYQRAVPPVGVFQIMGESPLVRGFAPDIRFFPKDEFLLYASEQRMTQDRLDKLVQEGKLIPAMAYVRESRHSYMKSGFMFDLMANKEYNDFLAQVERAYDFSEVET